MSHVREERNEALARVAYVEARLAEMQMELKMFKQERDEAVAAPAQGRPEATVHETEGAVSNEAAGAMRDVGAHATKTKEPRQRNSPRSLDQNGLDYTLVFTPPNRAATSDAVGQYTAKQAVTTASRTAATTVHTISMETGLQVGVP